MSVANWAVHKSGNWRGIPDWIAIIDHRNARTIVDLFNANQDLGGRGLGSSRRKARLLEQRAAFILRACQSHGDMLEALKEIQRQGWGSDALHGKCAICLHRKHLAEVAIAKVERRA